MRKKLKSFALSVLFFGLLVGISSCGNEDERPTITILTAPTELKVDDITTSSVTLSWKANAEAKSYDILFGNKLLSTNTLSYELTDLDPVTEYEWKLRARTDESAYSTWVDGPKFTTKTPGHVKFGDQTWDVVASYAVIDYDDPFIYMELFSNDPYATGTLEFPFVTFAILGNSVGVYDRQVDGFIAPDGNIDINYFENTALMGEYGDWWADAELENSIEITRIRNSTISGTLKAKMLDVIAYIMFDEFVYKDLEIEFSNIPISETIGSPVKGSVKKESAKKMISNTKKTKDINVNLLGK